MTEAGKIPSPSRLCEDWAQRVIDIWHEKMDSLGINYSSSSFLHHVISSSNGDVSRIEFVFNYYLKFTDMGVGKGVKIADVETDKTRRRKKPWLSSTFMLEVKKLANMMAANYAKQAAITIVQNIGDKK